MRVVNPVLFTARIPSCWSYEVRSLSRNTFRATSHLMAQTRSYRTAIDQVKSTPWSQTGPQPQSVPSSGSGGHVTHKAYIALGSNLGNRVEEIELACNEMTSRGIKVRRTSSLWETEPMYVLDQDRFLNAACEVCKAFTTVCISISLVLARANQASLYFLEFDD